MRGRKGGNRAGGRIGTILYRIMKNPLFLGSGHDVK